MATADRACCSLLGSLQSGDISTYCWIPYQRLTLLYAELVSLERFVCVSGGAGGGGGGHGIIEIVQDYFIV